MSTPLYQIGTYAAGNRLLDPDQRTEQSRDDRGNAITSGHRACRGCGRPVRGVDGNGGHPISRF